MRDIFTEAILREQRRIQSFIDLSVSAAGTKRGHLYVKTRGRCSYGYERWQSTGQPERLTYLGPLDSTPVQELFKARFQMQRLGRLRSDQKLLETLAQQYQPYDFDSVVSDMPRAYRLAAQKNSFDDRYEEIQEWAEADYSRNSFPFPQSENFAKDGTLLRSKGECIWYNMLQERGILFRYDSEIEFINQNGVRKKLCPDFLIQCLDGTFIIIEHLGRMGELRYAMDFGERCHWYFQDGFILGKNLFVSSDDPHFGTDSQMIARLVDRIEEMFYGF